MAPTVFHVPLTYKAEIREENLNSVSVEIECGSRERKARKSFGG